MDRDKQVDDLITHGYHKIGMKRPNTRNRTFLLKELKIKGRDSTTYQELTRFLGMVLLKLEQKFKETEWEGMKVYRRTGEVKMVGFEESESEQEDMATIMKQTRFNWHNTESYFPEFINEKIFDVYMNVDEGDEQHMYWVVPGTNRECVETGLFDFEAPRDPLPTSHVQGRCDYFSRGVKVKIKPGEMLVVNQSTVRMECYSSVSKSKRMYFRMTLACEVKKEAFMPSPRIVSTMVYNEYENKMEEDDFFL
jgi:hypothetical protein